MGTTRQWSLKEAGNISGGGGRSGRVGHNDWFIVCDFWREEEISLPRGGNGECVDDILTLWMEFFIGGEMERRWREENETERKENLIQEDGRSN